MEEKKKSALSVNVGVEQPPVVNKDAVKRLKLKRSQVNTETLTKGILSGDRTLLSRAITLVESNISKHYTKAQEVINNCLPHAGKSIRIGITGVPGVGKSTFIESFGTHLTRLGHKVAVLAIDPSSQRTKGSILGDKTRMECLSTNPSAFIRPSPSAGSLGGVARKTRETIILCEAAGFDVILIETVGVGQSETAVHSMVDFFLLLMLAGAGDELQGIKRGIMEMADLIAITKADGENINKAKVARVEYANAIHFFPPTESGWTPEVLTCSSLNNTGIDEVWNSIVEYKALATKNEYFTNRRIQQNQYWMFESIEEHLSQNFYKHPDINSSIEDIKRKVINEELSSFSAANILLETYFKSLTHKKQDPN